QRSVLVGCGALRNRHGPETVRWQESRTADECDPERAADRCEQGEFVRTRRLGKNHRTGTGKETREALPACRRYLLGLEATKGRNARSALPGCQARSFESAAPPRRPRLYPL